MKGFVPVCTSCFAGHDLLIVSVHTALSERHSGLLGPAWVQNLVRTD